MSQKTTPRKGGIFDNIIKDLEQDKLKFSVTPRKSLSFSIEDKENLKYTPSESLAYTQDKDKTFQIDHLKESYGHGHSYRSKSGVTLRKSVDAFRDIGEGTSANNILQAGMKTEKPPINKPGTMLQGNSNKLKMRDKLKKLKVTKAELTHIVKEIEVEKMKISELKHSIFSDIRRNFEDFVKSDEIKLKEDMNRCLAMINELQEWELCTEIKLEKFNAIMDDDIASMDEVLKKYDNLNILRQRGKNMDLKLIEKEKLEKMEKESRTAKDEIRQARENNEQFRQLHETAVQLNHVLSKQIEEQNVQIQKLQLVIDEQKLEEEEQRKRDSELEVRFQRLEKDKEDLKSTMMKDHESIESKYKRELEKVKLNFADELWQLNSFVKRISANLVHDYQPRSAATEYQDIRDDVEMLQLLRQNLSELGKTLDKELDKEKNKLQESHRDHEKSLGDEYNRYKENLQGKIEKEKEELRESLSLNFKKKTDDLLKEVWALKSQLQNTVPSEDCKKLEEKLKEKDAMINQLEEELGSWPKKLGDEVSKKVMEMRKENISSINELKEKHDQELTEKANEVKEFYTNLMEDEKQEINQIKEENDFLNKELESANKQIFELMKYKGDFEGSLETERKKLEQRYVENQELVALDFESKFRALQETNLKTIRTYEEKINKQRMESERDKVEVRETLQNLQDEYEDKIQELKDKYQEKIDEYREKMQAFSRFREGHEKNVAQISTNLKQIKDQLAEKECVIADKDKEIISLMSRIEFLEHERGQKGAHNQSLMNISTESSRIKQKKILQQLVQKVGNLGEALGGSQSYKPIPGQLRANNLSNTSIDMKPAIQIGKEIEQLTKELDQDISQTFIIHDNEHESLVVEDKSFDAHHHNQQHNKLSKTLNTSNQSLISNYRHNNTYAYSQDDFKEKSILYQANKENKCIQSDFRDDSIFPPFDHRVCLRCKKNDLTSPNYCKYSNLQKLEDLSFHSNKSSVGYKISKSHIYGINVGFKSKIEPSVLNETMQKKSYHVEYSDKAGNTIISNNDFSSQDLSDLREEDLKELRTPRTDEKWDMF